MAFHSKALKAGVRPFKKLKKHVGRQVQRVRGGRAGAFARSPFGSIGKGLQRLRRAARARGIPTPGSEIIKRTAEKLEKVPRIKKKIRRARR